jgi:hypothetical protein
MKRTLAILLSCAALGACATPTLYGPAAGPAASGFWETRLETDRFRVGYRGGIGAPPAQVADFALFRAAEVTKSAGYDWFRIVSRFDDGVAGRGPQLSLGTGSTSFGRRSAVGVGIGTSFDLGGGPQLSTNLEIKLGRGPKPNEYDVYAADEVIRAIGPRIPGGPPIAL